MKSGPLAVLVMATLIGGSVGASAGASPGLEHSTEVTSHPSPRILGAGASGNLTNYLSSVSCVSPVDCMAVGGSSSETLQQQTLVESWNGTAWWIVPSPNPAGFESVLNSVSCTSAVDCVAVGLSSTQPPGAGSQTLIESWNGHAWSIVPAPSNNGNNALASVSCATSTDCMAVGGVGSTLAESWNGSAWTIVPSPSVGVYSALATVSCAATTQCTAVGVYVATDSSSSQTLVESWNGTSWSVVPSPSPPGRESLLNGVSCNSPSSCVAVGGDNFGQTVTETWNGSQWTIVPGPNIAGSDSNLTAVSCTGPASCVAVGWSEGSTPFGPDFQYRTLVAAWDGASWSVAPSPSPSIPSYLNGVSCTTPTTCVAVGLSGNYSDVSGNEQTLIVAWSGGSWSLVPSPNLSALVAPVVGMAATPTGDGYWLADSAGDVTAHGSARMYGSMSGRALNARISHIVATPDGGGYWLVAADGGVFTFGDARFYGSMGGTRLNAPVLDMAPTPSGQGYWLVAADGGVFSFGDARFSGSMGGRALNKPVVGMAADNATGGYWLVAADGGIFAFAAPFYGSTGSIVLNKPVLAIAATADSGGYWFAASDGGVFSFGDARFSGSMGGRHLNAPVTGMAADTSTGGYWLVGSDGGVFSFNAPFLGAG